MQVDVYQRRIGARRGGRGQVAWWQQEVDGAEAERVRVASSSATWLLQRYHAQGAGDGNDTTESVGPEEEKCVDKTSNGVMISRFPRQGHFSEDWLFELAAGAWVVRVDVVSAHRAYPVLAPNTLLILDSVWPQDPEVWREVGEYVCGAREGGNPNGNHTHTSSNLVVVLFGDEYHQAPRFIYEQV